MAKEAHEHVRNFTADPDHYTEQCFTIMCPLFWDSCVTFPCPGRSRQCPEYRCCWLGGHGKGEEERQGKEVPQQQGLQSESEASGAQALEGSDTCHCI